MTQEKKMFTLENGPHTETVRGRQVAVRTAREMSEATWRPVRLVREDARMEMVFRRGELASYGYESHKRR